MNDDEASDGRELFKALSFLTVFLLGFLAVVIFLFSKSIPPLFGGGEVLLWDKWVPLLPFVAVSISALWWRTLVLYRRQRREPNTENLLRPTFKYDQYLIIAAALLGLAAPFILQPIIDFMVMPFLGYAYCEALTTRQSTFGFPTYAYVKDLALCVE